MWSQMELEELQHELFRGVLHRLLPILEFRPGSAKSVGRQVNASAKA